MRMQRRERHEDRDCSPSGNIGRRTEKITQAGAETVLLTRHPAKLADLVEGATVKPVSSDDSQGLIEATQHADALFWLTHQN